MIRVRAMGHIRTSLGKQEVALPGDELEVSEMVDRLRAMSKEENPGFNRFNVLALVEDGEAFVPASSGRKARSGESWVLITFSHGG